MTSGLLRRGGGDSRREMLLLYEDNCDCPPKFWTKEQFVKLALLNGPGVWAGVGPQVDDAADCSTCEQ